VVHPDDLSRLLASVEDALAGRRPFLIDHRICLPDGSIRYVHERAEVVRDERGHPLRLVGTMQDITERKQAEARQKLLIDELNHRVKNTLATVQSLAAQTARGTDTPEEFRQAFEGRLIALSQAHDQLTRRHWQSADLRDIVTGATGPHLSHPQEQLRLEGEAITVSPRIALTLALVLHEMTTNAAKYGALSLHEGRIEISWLVEPRPTKSSLLHIEWRERNGPSVEAPARPGFGSRFIQGSVTAELRGTVRMDFDPDGLRCVIDIPLDPVGDEQPPQAT